MKHDVTKLGGRGDLSCDNEIMMRGNNVIINETRRQRKKEKSKVNLLE